MIAGSYLVFQICTANKGSNQAEKSRSQVKYLHKNEIIKEKQNTIL